MLIFPASIFRYIQVQLTYTLVRVVLTQYRLAAPGVTNSRKSRESLTDQDFEQNSFGHKYD
jgi:hypothetical protein